MKQIVTNQTVKIPEGLTVTAKGRQVTVTGPRGTLKRSFKHLALDIHMVNQRLLKVEKWFGTKKELASVRTVCSHIENMLKGVTKGYQYKMRAVYAHFPINCTTSEGDSLIEIRWVLWFDVFVIMIAGLLEVASKPAVALFFFNLCP